MQLNTQQQVVQALEALARGPLGVRSLQEHDAERGRRCAGHEEDA